MNANLAAVLYLVAGVLFILSLRGLSSPASSRQGNLFGMIGMAIAVVTTLFAAQPSGALAWFVIILAVAIGGTAGAVIAKRIPMTAMPQLIAGFHSLVGMAAVLVAAAALYSPAAFGIGEVGHIHTGSLIEMSLGAAIGAITSGRGKPCRVTLRRNFSGSISLPSPWPNASVSPNPRRNKSNPRSTLPRVLGRKKRDKVPIVRGPTLGPPRDAFRLRARLRPRRHRPGR